MFMHAAPRTLVQVPGGWGQLGSRAVVVWEAAEPGGGSVGVAPSEQPEVAVPRARQRSAWRLLLGPDKIRSEPEHVDRQGRDRLRGPGGLWATGWRPAINAILGLSAAAMTRSGVAPASKRRYLL